ncbi:MAG TPA: arylesterase [Chthoniobacterales bacterium]|nr:arylesterase [Chthoniobacterales bacterium]
MKSIILAGTLVAVLVFAAFQSAPAAKRDAPKVITIVALGDSLTEGYGLSRKQAYPALVAEKMRSAGYEFEVVNAGWSGDTTAGGLRRLPEILRTRKKIDILILALGINDAFRGVPIDQMRSNLQTIIDRTRARQPGVSIIIAGMQLPLASSDGYVRAFGEMFAALAEKNDAALIPYLLEGVGGDPELNLPDRVHPNAAGQRVLAQNVWRVLEPILQKTWAATSPRGRD